MGRCDPVTLELFNFEGCEVRVVILDGEPWWVAADVARALGFRDASNGVRAARLRDRQQGYSLVSTPGGTQRMHVVSESGLYRLVMASRHEQAERFQDWVTDEVLPAVRKTGSYSLAPALLDPASDHETALVMLAQVSARALEEYRGRRAAEARAAELEPPARAWSALADTRRDYSVGEAAKILSRDPAISTGRQRLFGALVDLGLVYTEKDGRRRSYKPYQQHVDAGRFVLRMGSQWQHPKTGEMEAGAPQLRITAKGLAYLHKKLGGTGALQLDDDDYGGHRGTALAS